MSEAKTGLISRNLLSVVLALMLGASLATNVFLMFGPPTAVPEEAEAVPCDAFWCSLTSWD